ncbi:unnamed protein product [Meloidogyne enterolobii]|uniref:Uncharacterized protein n=1 Tax=Meloidogyne enterolobii TaxID=390850 RepID=A0ACB1A121_MELEN
MMEKLLLPQILSIARIQPPCVLFHWKARMETRLVSSHANIYERKNENGVLTKKHSKLNVANISLITSVHSSGIR